MPDEVRVEVDGRTLKLSNLDKVLYPRTGTTKGEVLNYYAQVAPVLLPHARGPRGDPGPLAERRRAGRFFEKNAPAGAPSWVRTPRCRRGELGWARRPSPSRSSTSSSFH